MKRLLISGWLGMALATSTSLGADSIFESFGLVTGIPDIINATNFVNHGTWSIATLRPYETYDTVNYTNFGIMVGGPGYRFEYSPSSGAQRKLAGSFINYNPGAIQAVDSGVVNELGQPCFRTRVGTSYLFIGATNVVTGAGLPGSGSSLIVGANGVMQIVGENVDLSNSGIEVLSPAAEALGSVFVPPNTRTNFLQDIAITDLNWVQAAFNDNYRLTTRALWDGFNASFPGVPQPPSAPGASPGGSFGADWGDYYFVFDTTTITLTNFIGDPTNVTEIISFDVEVLTNIYKGAVLASAPAGFGFANGFEDSPAAPDNPFKNVSLLIATTLTNVTTGSTEPAYIHVEDTLASDRRFRGLSLDLVGCGNATFRPINFLVDRFPTLTGQPNGFGFPDPDFFVSTGNYLINTNVSRDLVTNSVVNAGEYASYGSWWDNIVLRPPTGFGIIPGANETNFSGRLRVSADNLNLENTRIRGQGQVILEAAHLVSSANAVIDCENLNFNLASTNGSLKIDHVGPNTVSRLRGRIYCWSGVWTNSVLLVMTNYAFTNVPIFDPPGSTNVTGTNIVAIYSPITNVIAVGFAATMVNADGLQTTVQASVFKAEMRGKDVVFNDTMSIIRQFLLDGSSFTLNGQITFPGVYPPDPITGGAPADPVIQSWQGTNSPNLLYFTNHGVLNIISELHLGDDRPSPLAAFENTGFVVSAGINIRSHYLQNSGSLLSSQGSIHLAGDECKLENGDSASATDTRFDVRNLKLNQYQVSAGGWLVFNVENELADSGPGAAVLVQLRDGFRMERKPLKGSLLGSTFDSVASAVPNQVVNHTWAAEDRGPTEAGYVDNAAIGRLSLSTLGPNPRMNFSPATGHNALYVDLLDLQGLTNYTSWLRINPGMVIYYAAAELPTGFTPPDSNGVPVLPEEYLDGQFGGRLRWVRTFAGPNSSTPVVINGQTHLVNTALANSRFIDSDGDGVANYFDGVLAQDGDKFSVATVSVNVNGSGSVIPAYQSASLLIGETYTVTATSRDGAVFTGWTGSIPSASPQIQFVLTSNLTLTANFNYPGAAATYRGLFYEAGGVQFLKSGAVTASTTTRRTYSGSLQLGKNKYSFRGTFNAEGMATNVIPRSGANALILRLQAGLDRLTGTVDDGTWQADLTADRAAYSSANPSPVAGKYTLNFPGGTDAANNAIPHGDGFGSVTVATAGTIKLKGALADGTKLSQSSAVSQAGQWPFYVPLYGGKGQILAWLTFEDTGAADLSGLVSWIHQPDAVAKYYPAGFDLELEALGSAYSSLANPLPGFSEGVAAFTGGNLSSPIYNGVAIGDLNRVSNLGVNKLTMKLKSADGTFSGTVIDPATGKSIKFSGALLQKQRTGVGYFLGPNESGKAVIGPSTN